MRFASGFSLGLYFLLDKEVFNVCLEFVLASYVFDDFCFQ